MCWSIKASVGWLAVLQRWSNDKNLPTTAGLSLFFWFVFFPLIFQKASYVSSEAWKQKQQLQLHWSSCPISHSLISTAWSNPVAFVCMTWQQQRPHWFGNLGEAITASEPSVKLQTYGKPEQEHVWRFHCLCVCVCVRVSSWSLGCSCSDHFSQTPQWTDMIPDTFCFI